MIFNLTMPTSYYATIVVSATTGSTVTCTYTDGTVYRANEVSGKWTFKVKKQGSYTIRGVLGSRSTTSTVSVQERKTYNVTLTYPPIVTYITLTITGVGTTKDSDVVYASAGGYSAAGTYRIVSGAALELFVRSGTSTSGIIYKVKNGKQSIAASTNGRGTATYTLRPTKNLTIKLEVNTTSHFGDRGYVYYYE